MGEGVAVGDGMAVAVAVGVLVGVAVSVGDGVVVGVGVSGSNITELGSLMLRMSPLLASRRATCHS